MKLAFGEKTYETLPWRSLPAKYLKVNDFIIYNGDLLKVVTVQRDCPSLSNLSKVFVQFTFQTQSGIIVPARNLQGLRQVAKPKRRVLQ